MLCYELVYKCALNCTEEDNHEKKIQAVNKLLNIDFDENYSCIFRASEDGFNAVAMTVEPAILDQLSRKIEELTVQMMNAKMVDCCRIREITVKELSVYVNMGWDNGFFELGRRRFSRNAEMKLDFESGCFNVKEEVLDEMLKTRNEAEKKANVIMADSSLKEELDRIYFEGNSSSFYGVPVHYHIKAGNMEAAMEIVYILAKALHSRGRLPSARISTITSITAGCFNESGMDNLIEKSGLSAVVMELKGVSDEQEYATEFGRVEKYLSDHILRNKEDTQFFFIENTSEPGFGRHMIDALSEKIDIVLIKEGRGDRDEAREYLKGLILSSRYAELADDRVFKELDDRNSYLAADVHKTFESWKRRCLKEKAYISYSSYRRYKTKKVYKKQRAYEKLMGMTGLNNVKSLADRILAFYRLEKKRERFGIESCDISRHMIFTGNPGCAKTTVARLIAEILSEEQILETGVFVECGRSDLVGKYVGWTAKNVKRKFREAKGGVLFIDEAYALLDDSHSFGDEAINTIVQEMENVRKEVIVIFAGYPAPMNDFLERNDGLSSRIAFHVSFEDYSVDELLNILELMSKERGYRVSGDALEKCSRIFYNASKVTNFGNGRYVRNMLEKAMLNQSERLYGQCSRNINKSQLQTLLPEDFEELKITYREEKKQRIGF